MKLLSLTQRTRFVSPVASSTAAEPFTRNRPLTLNPSPGGAWLGCMRATTVNGRTCAAAAALGAWAGGGAWAVYDLVKKKRREQRSRKKKQQDKATGGENAELRAGGESLVIVITAKEQ